MDGKNLAALTGDHINKSFSQEDIWLFCRAAEKVAITTRLPYYQGGH